MILSDFRIIRPRFETRQEEILDWIARTHAGAEAISREQKGETSTFDAERFAQRMRKLTARYGCHPGRISSRGHEMDYRTSCDRILAEDAPRRRGDSPSGALRRTLFYDQAVADVFRRFYAEETSPPDDLIHATCTGYVSPSGAQRLVQQRRWGNQTRVTHAYHMGCYASIPALRQASGFLKDGSSRVDLVHTELCALHLNPFNHAPEQLVVEGLFADGYVRYSAFPEGAAPRGSAAYRVLSLREAVLPDTEDRMSWLCADWGMRMVLARDVPSIIAPVLNEFVSEIGSAAGPGYDFRADSTLFAIHPGGPKIIDGVQEALGLSELQVKHSQSALYRYGNMSSATLPHIWENILRDGETRSGDKVVSLAFGPGLTVCGALLEVMA